MSYYILPKNNNTIVVEPNNMVKNDDKVYNMPIISCSIYNYYNEVYNNILFLCESLNDLSYNTFDDLIKIINPY